MDGLVFGGRSACRRSIARARHLGEDRGLLSDMVFGLRSGQLLNLRAWALTSHSESATQDSMAIPNHLLIFTGTILDR